MTGRIRRFYLTVGLIAVLLLALALLVAALRATPEGGLRQKPDRVAVGRAGAVAKNKSPDEQVRCC